MIEISLVYGGEVVDVKFYPEEDCRGTKYPVEMNGIYYFTLHLNEDEDWAIVRESDGTTPQVEDVLFNDIVKKLEYQLRYAA